MSVITCKIIIIISSVKKVLGDPGAVSLVKTKKEPLQKYSRSGERDPGMLYWTNQF